MKRVSRTFPFFAENMVNGVAIDSPRESWTQSTFLHAGGIQLVFRGLGVDKSHAVDILQLGHVNLVRLRGACRRATLVAPPVQPDAIAKLVKSISKFLRRDETVSIRGAKTRGNRESQRCAG